MATYTIDLDKNRDNFALPSSQNVVSGDKIKFHSSSGNFSIIIRNAFPIFTIDDDKIEVYLTEGNTSAEYEVRQKPLGGIKVYEICCESNHTWPDAPPRIIIAAA